MSKRPRSDRTVTKVPTPRAAGSAKTMMIDPGLATGAFTDVIESFAPLIDFVKFGWGTALVTPEITRKIAVLRDANIDFFFGGTLFEHELWAGRIDAFADFLRAHDARFVEISNGTIPITEDEKARWITRFASEFSVLSEVGFKDVGRAAAMSAEEWVDAIAQDRAAGASLVIAEARESGRSGIAQPDGRIREDVLRALLDGVELPAVMFEAPTKDLQVELISRIGPDVNLGNVAAADIVGLATLRRGLRGDTLLDLVPRRHVDPAATVVRSLPVDSVA